MKKFYVSKKDLNDEELRTGKVSYGRIVNRLIGNLVLCNNIGNIDNSIWEQVAISGEVGDYEEIYQFYLCNVPDYIIEWNKELNTPLIISYSEMLDTYVLMVNHFGTSWDYVMTDVEWSEDYEECK